MRVPAPLRRIGQTVICNAKHKNVTISPLNAPVGYSKTIQTDQVLVAQWLKRLRKPFKKSKGKFLYSAVSSP